MYKLRCHITFLNKIKPTFHAGMQIALPCMPKILFDLFVLRVYVGDDSQLLPHQYLACHL